MFSSAIRNENVSGNLNRRICFHALPGANSYWEECACVALLQDSSVKLSGIFLSKFICIQNVIMLNGNLWNNYGGLFLTYINILVQGIWFYMTRSVLSSSAFFLAGHTHLDNLEAIPNHQDGSSIKAKHSSLCCSHFDPLKDVKCRFGLCVYTQLTYSRALITAGIRRGFLDLSRATAFPSL